MNYKNRIFFGEDFFLYSLISFLVMTWMSASSLIRYIEIGEKYVNQKNLIEGSIDFYLTTSILSGAMALFILAINLRRAYTIYYKW